MSYARARCACARGLGLCRQVYYHPRLPSPHEHDPKPGKRAFGWLVRYLLRRPPSCPCAACASRFARLSQSAIVDAQGGDRSGGVGGGDVGDGGGGSLGAARAAVAAWGLDASTGAAASVATSSSADFTVARVVSGVGEGKFQVDCALVSASARRDPRGSARGVAGVPSGPRRLAILCAESLAREDGAPKAPTWDVREQCGVVPAVLGDPKLGWDGCGHLSLAGCLAPLLRYVAGTAAAPAASQTTGDAAGEGGNGASCGDGKAIRTPSVQESLSALSRGSAEAAATATGPASKTAPPLRQRFIFPLCADPKELAAATTGAAPIPSIKASSMSSIPVLKPVGSLDWLHGACDAFERVKAKADATRRTAAVAAARTALAARVDAGDDGGDDDEAFDCGGPAPGQPNFDAVAGDAGRKKPPGKAKGAPKGKGGGKRGDDANDGSAIAEPSDEEDAAVLALCGGTVAGRSADDIAGGLEGLKVLELKAALKRCGLPVSGKKGELTARLAHHVLAASLRVAARATAAASASSSSWKGQGGAAASVARGFGGGDNDSDNDGAFVDVRDEKDEEDDLANAAVSPVRGNAVGPSGGSPVPAAFADAPSPTATAATSAPVRAASATFASPMSGQTPSPAAGTATQRRRRAAWRPSVSSSEDDEVCAAHASRDNEYDDADADGGSLGGGGRGAAAASPVAKRSAKPKVPKPPPAAWRAHDSDSSDDDHRVQSGEELHENELPDDADSPFSPLAIKRTPARTAKSTAKEKVRGGLGGLLRGANDGSTEDDDDSGGSMDDFIADDDESEEYASDDEEEDDASNDGGPDDSPGSKRRFLHKKAKEGRSARTAAEDDEKATARVMARLPGLARILAGRTGEGAGSDDDDDDDDDDEDDDGDDDQEDDQEDEDEEENHGGKRKSSAAECSLQSLRDTDDESD